MTIEEKKAWLRTYISLGIEIKNYKEELVLWNERATSLPNTLKEPTGTKSASSRAEAAIERIDEIERVIIKKIREQTERRLQMEQAVNSLADTRLRTLIWLRYIKGKRWEDICVELRYSWQQIHRMHREALQRIQIKDEIECYTLPVV